MSPWTLPQQAALLTCLSLSLLPWLMSENSLHTCAVCWRLGCGKPPYDLLHSCVLLPLGLGVLPGPGLALCLAPHMGHKDFSVGESRRPEGYMCLPGTGQQTRGPSGTLGSYREGTSIRQKAHTWHGIAAADLGPVRSSPGLCPLRHPRPALHLGTEGTLAGWVTGRIKRADASSRAAPCTTEHRTLTSHQMATGLR